MKQAPPNWLLRFPALAVAGTLVLGTVQWAGLAGMAAADPAVNTPPVAAVPLVVPGSPVVPGAKAGTLGSSWNVAPSGEFSYSISLEVPKGRGGMSPELSLEYSSVGGNGPAGMGWQLSGLGSSITRCGQSLDAEGTVTGVRFDKTDRFCLDGEKLVAVGGPNPSSYGDDGVHYRAEANGFADIASFGSAQTIASGPDYFAVTAKNGWVWIYRPHSGTQVSSGVAFTPGPVDGDKSSVARRVIWLPDTVEDPSGNAMTWEYEESTGEAGAEYLVKRIRYTHHSNGADAHRYVEIEYEPRPDVSFSFQGGVRFQKSKRIKSVGMYAPNPAATSLVWKYVLKYVPESGSGIGRSLLASATKCGPSGTCLPAKKFTWDHPAPVPAFAAKPLGTQIVNTTGTRQPWMHVLDLDSDGTDDLLYTLGGTNDSDSPVYVRLGTRNAAGVASPLAELRMLTASQGAGFPANTQLPYSRPMDLDADGRSEFAAQYKDASMAMHDKIVRWDAAAKAFVDTGISIAASAQSTDFADMNGDGRPDYLNGNVQIGPLKYYSVRLNTGAGFAPPVATGFVAGCFGPRVTDLDGDGRAELVAQQADTTTGKCGKIAHSLRLDGGGTGGYNVAIQPAGATVGGVTYHRALTGGKSTTPDYTTIAGDFNGDGLADSLIVPPVDGFLRYGRVLWNTGAGLRLGPYEVALPAQQTDLRIADLNGDGRDDIVAFHAATTVSISRGDGSFTSGDIAADGGANDPEVGRSTSQLGDFDGDGRADIVRITNNQMTVLTHNSTGFEERMTAVSDEGATHWREHVTYSRAWSDHPEKTTSYASAYPLRSVRSGLVVARQVTSWAHFVDNSPGNVARVMRYSFDDPVADVRAGGGFVGFGTFTVWDPRRPSQTVTAYEHRTQKDGKRYPLARTPSMVTTAVPILTQAQVAQAPGNAKARVTRTRYTPEYRPLDPPGTRYAVLPNTSATKEWEQQVTITWAELPGTQTVSHLGSLTEPGNAPVRVDTDVDVDGTGSTTKATRQTAGGITETARIDYEYRTPAGPVWITFPLPWKQSIERAEAGGDPGAVTRRTEYHHDSALRLDAVYVEKDNPDASLRRTTTYEYTDYGSVRRVVQSADGLPDRDTRFEYTPVWAGQPAEEVYSSQVWFQHDTAKYRPSTWSATHPGYGVTVATATATGATAQGLAETVASQAVFDEFGRRVKDLPAGGPVVDIGYAGRPDAAGGVKGIVATSVTTYSATSKSTSATSADSLGRTVKAVVDGFDGTDTTVTTTYDALGRVASVTRPFFGTTPGAAAGTIFDSLDRPVTETAPDGAVTGHDYPDQFTAETTSPTGQHTSIVTDADRRAVSSVATLVKPDGSARDVVTTYGYAPFDLLHTVTDDAGHVTTFDYDTLGRRVRVQEPDRGVTTSTYYGTGDLRTETHEDAGTASTFGYDDLGRQISKVNGDGTTTFVFDLAPHGLGKLASATSPDGIVTGHRYDALGRGIGLDYTDQGTGTSYAVDTTFDGAGRVHTLSYPDPDGAGPLPRMTTKNTYNAAGYQQRIDDVTPGRAAALLWFVGTRKPDLSLATGQLGQSPGQINIARTYYDATGRIKHLAATNPAGTKLQDLAYTYHDNGLVKTRTQNDTAAQRSETFGYDTLSRLTNWQLTNGTAAPVSTGYGYDTIGNIYPQPASGAEDRSYGDAGGTRPHALTMRDSSAGVETFHYDAKGRLVTTRAEDGSATRAVTYTSFDLPKTVTKDGVTTTFAYDAFGTRVKETNSGSVTFTVPGHYEKRTTAAQTRHVHYVDSVDGPIGQVVTTVSNTGAHTTATEFTLTDALGSTTATATAGGSLGQAFFYDPFGARIAPGGGAPPAAGSGEVTHGFTGHEHDDDLGLINMKGRVYDPSLSRFLTPDPAVSDRYDGQSWNPYSYVRNTPLNYTDPTGLVSCAFVVSGPCESYGGALGGGPVPVGGDPWVKACVQCVPVGGASEKTDKNKKPVKSDQEGSQTAVDNPDAEAQAATAIDIGGPTETTSTPSVAAGETIVVDGVPITGENVKKMDAIVCLFSAGLLCEPSAESAEPAKPEMVCAGIYCGDDPVTDLVVKPSVWIIMLLFGGGGGNNANAVATSEEGINSPSSLRIAAGTLLGAAMVIGPKVVAAEGRATGTASTALAETAEAAPTSAAVPIGALEGWVTQATRQMLRGQVDHSGEYAMQVVEVGKHLQRDGWTRVGMLERTAKGVTLWVERWTKGGNNMDLPLGPKNGGTYDGL